MKGKLTKQRTISPFEGEPHTLPMLNENGQPGFMVKIHETTPEGAKKADSRATLRVFMLFCLCLFIVPPGNPVWFAGLIAPIYMRKRFVRSFLRKFAKTTEVIFTPTEFHIKRKNGWEIYDRTLTHSFAKIDHDLARDERDEHARLAQRDQMNRKVIARKRYYDESYHIIFMYMGQRIDVADVYDQKRATAVRARLKACDKMMDTKNQMGEGEVLSPGDQWRQTPGDLPDE